MKEQVALKGKIKDFVTQIIISGYNAKANGQTWEQGDGSVNLPDRLILLYTLQILNLFKALLDKLTVMTDAEVKVILEKGFDINIKPESQEHIQRIIQLQDTRKQLYDLIGE